MNASGNPKRYLNHIEVDSPLGRIVLGEYNGRICLAEFKGGGRADNGLRSLASQFDTELSRKQTPVLQAAKRQLNLYFSGKLSRFTLPLSYSGTDFQKSVWKQLEKIPFGKTVNYGWVAEKAGNPKGSRAVGAAVGNNRISIIVPCHRVIGKDGSLTGYGGGLKKKEWLLMHERSN